MVYDNDICPAKSEDVFDRDGLDPNHYTISLLNKACRFGLINRQTADSIQMQVLNILKDVILRYTGGESSSIALDTAENLLSSIYYSIDAYACSFVRPEEFLEQLKLKGIRGAYEGGVKIVTDCARETEKLYRKIRKDKLEVPLETYNSTIDEAVQGFFMKYGVVFNACDTAASMDYPVILDDMSIRGVFYIKQYLEKLEIETSFCRCFRKEDHLLALEGYSRIHGMDCSKTPTNLFEVLASNSIAAVLAGNHAGKLKISKTQYELLCGRLYGLVPAELSLLADEAVEGVIGELGISRPEVAFYIRRFKGVFKPRLLNAVENGSLYDLVPVSEEEEKSERIIFEAGERMSDAEFRRLTGRIGRCRKASDKINVIVSSVHSFYDFIDLLDSDCLYGKEIPDLYSCLSDVELSALGLAVFSRELRNEPLKLDCLRESGIIYERDWQIKYAEFVESLEESRRKAIEGCINRLRFAHESTFDYRLWK